MSKFFTLFLLDLPILFNFFLILLANYVFYF